MARRRSASRAPPMVSGSWTGVRNTNDPMDDSPQELVRATNVYRLGADQPVGSWSQRPGATLANPAGQLGTTNTRLGQAITYAADDTGALVNFEVCGGKLYRVSGAAFGTHTDVTPANVTIDATARVYMTAYAGTIVVNDGVHPPWVGTALTNTPIVATPIPYVTNAGALLSASTTGVALRAFRYLSGSTVYGKAAVTNSPLTGPIVPESTWGVWRVSLATSGTITVTSGADNATGYVGEAAALADTPALPAGEYNLGVVTAEKDAGGINPGSTLFSAMTVVHITTPSPDEPWQAYGAPRLYGDSVFFVLRDVPNESALNLSRSVTSTGAWSEPSDPLTGYRQTNFDNEWTFRQTGATPLFAFFGTNLSLHYWRDDRYGALQGPVGPDLRNSATQDAGMFGHGTHSPNAIVAFGETIYFVDTRGRPFRITPGSPPEPIWEQLRSIVESAATNAVDLTAACSAAAVVPELDLVAFAIWSPDATNTAARPTTLELFTASSGVYLGQWTIGAGVRVDAMGVLIDAAGAPVLAVLGTAVPSQGADAGGYLWTLAHIGDDQWTDEGLTSMVPAISTTTHRIGYSADTLWNYDRLVAVLGSQGACQVTIQTSTGNAVDRGVTTPNASNDGTFRATWGLDDVGHGLSATISPTTVSERFVLHRVEAVAVPSLMGADEL